MMNCDADSNGYLDYCEVHDCVEMVEDDWRATNCPCYGWVYCPSPVECKECPGMMHCDELENWVLSIFGAGNMDSNGDFLYNPHDDYDKKHYDDFLAGYDFNNDGNIEYCEVY
jgi:hypothetical protein